MRPFLRLFLLSMDSGRVAILLVGVFTVNLDVCFFGDTNSLICFFKTVNIYYLAATCADFVSLYLSYK